MTFNIGVIAAFLTTTAFVPQAIKTIRSGETKNLSLSTFSMIFFGTICWCVHGFIIEDQPLILANGITAVLAGVIVTIKLNSMISKADR